MGQGATVAAWRGLSNDCTVSAGLWAEHVSRSSHWSKAETNGAAFAFAQDIIELADRLRLRRFHFVGHDWGARTGYALAALFPQRLKSLVAISVPYEPGKAQPPKFPQAHAFWYQWLLCTNPGEEKFREDPAAFGQAQWDAWGPTGWYTKAEFAAAKKSWKGKDFEDVVLHSYRSRWGHTDLDPVYAGQQAKFLAAKTLHVPTMLLHGRKDYCELAETTNGAERHFTGKYTRLFLEGVGHFPQRENPADTAAAIAYHLQETS